jgi:hypothetical protein
VANYLRYRLTDEEALAVVIPNVIVLEYIQRTLAKRVTAQMLLRAVLLKKKMRRETKKAKDLEL